MSTELVPRTTVSEVCAHRDAAMRTMQEAVAQMVRGLELAEQANHYAQLAHGAACFTLSDRSKSDAYRRLFEAINPKESLEAYRQQVDARVWMNLLALTGLETMMDRTAKDELYKQLCGEVPVVSEENIYATFETLARDAKLIFQRGLARAFIELDRRFRSHDGFKIGGRIILTRVFNEWGSWNLYTRMGDTITDIERVFTVLDGKNKPDADGRMPRFRHLVDAIDRDRGHGFERRQSTTQATYFRIHTFKNGNAHLWFTRDDLVEKANLVLAEYYGEVLPDGVPDDVTADDIKHCSVALCKDLSFYPTPDPVVQQIMSDLYVDGKSHVLEPSAGTGNIVRALLAKGASVDAIEVDPGRVAALQQHARMNRRLTVTHGNFLTTLPRPTYSHVVMNPPFYGTHYMQHVMHAFDFLRPGGTLVSVLPATVETGDTKQHEAFRKWVEQRKDNHTAFYDLPLESFATSGTRISTVYVKLRKR